MHYVNWISRQDFGETTNQVISAGLGGILYGALALRTGSIWPGVALHALWDAVVSMNGMLTANVVAEVADSGSTDDGGTSIFAFLIGNFEPILGVIVLIGWWRWRRAQTT